MLKTVLRRSVTKSLRLLIKTLMIQQQYKAILASLFYAFTSIGVTFSLKIILGKTYNFGCPIFLIIIQNISSLLLLKISNVNLEPLQWSLVKQWLPLNIFFVLMLTTSTFSLQLLSVSMVTIFKNLQTILVAMGDVLLFKEPLGVGSFTGIGVMLVGSLIAGYNDLEYDAVGYAWITLNCICGATYVLYMKFAMASTSLSTLSSVYYNNFLSLPFLLMILMLSKELPMLLEKSLWDKFEFDFWMVFVLNIFLGSVMSFAALWMVKITSPTTYSIVGAVNKVPLALFSIWWFQTKFNFAGGVSGSGALLGSIIYAITKPAKRKEEAPTQPTQQEV